MKTAPTPPDMTAEQARELKQLRARAAKLVKQSNAAITAANRRMERIDEQLTREHSKLTRELKVKLRAIAKPLLQEQRQHRTAINRIAAETHPLMKELSTIARRIAVLEGRLGS